MSALSPTSSTKATAVVARTGLDLSWRFARGAHHRRASAVAPHASPAAHGHGHPRRRGRAGWGDEKSPQAAASKSVFETSRLARKGSSHRRSPNVRAGPELSPKFFLIPLASAHSSPSSSTDAQWIPFFRVSNVLRRCLDCKGIGHHEKQDLHPDVLRGERNPQS